MRRFSNVTPQSGWF